MKARVYWRDTITGSEGKGNAVSLDTATAWVQAMNKKHPHILHVIVPLGPLKCPKCGSEDVEKGGNWDWGPFYWYCQDCDHRWGFV